jgi:PKD repeat protein
VITRGGNYGWPVVEGMCTVNCGTYINPVHTYNHSGLSSAVTGGPVYRGDMFPASYAGRYFFGDYARGFIKTLQLSEDGTTSTVQDFDLNAGSVVDLQQAYDGSIYYITYYPGRLYRISYSEGNSIPVANAGADVTKGVDPLTVNFTSAGTFDPDGSALTYLWNFDDGTTSTQANPTKIFTAKGTYTVTLHVSDGPNTAEAVPIVIQVGLPPTVRIASPDNNSLWRMGDTIFYTASGVDGAGFDLHDADFTTEVLFHHDTHTHPFLGPIQSKTGTFAIPLSGEHDPDVWLEILVTAYDTNGLSTTERVNIYPVKSLYKVETNVPGLTINIDGVPTVAPYESLGVVNYQRELDAPLIQSFEGKLYQFESWSDGGAPKHIVSVPESDVVWTATYQEIPSFTGQYFNNQNLTGVPVLTRQDQFIDFEWYGGSPGPGVNPNNFSVRWTRSQNFGGGSYTFNTITDDGVRLYIDNVLIIDKWQDQGSVPHTATIDLTPGIHEVKMEYYDNQFDAIAKLNWTYVPNSPSPTATASPSPSVSPSVSPSISPSASVSPSASPSISPSPTAAGYNAAFWNVPGTGAAPAIPATAPVLTRVDPTIDFDWGMTAPGVGVDAEHFVARWTRTVNFDAGTYRFRTESDDGIRVYVDNVPVIDQWNDHGVTVHTGDRTLTAGNHDLRIEFYDNTYDAVSKFSYSLIAAPSVSPTASPTASATVVPTASPSVSPSVSPTASPVVGSTITVYAAGLQAAGVYPTMQLAIDNQVVATFTNVDGAANIPTYKPYTYTHAAAVTGSQVKVIFTNDVYISDNEDRNLRVDRITINGVSYQSENPLVYSTGVDVGPSCAPGYQQSEWLNCDGYFQYYNQAQPTVSPSAIPTASPTVAPTASPSPTVSPSVSPSPTTSPIYFAEYYNNKTLSGPPVLTRNETVINNDWGMGSPDTIVTVNNFSARWSKTDNFAAGMYRFTMSGDDGVRLYIDNQIVLDKWIDQSTTTYIVDVPIQAGNHAIRFEYYENGYDAVAKMNYVLIGALPSPSVTASPTASPSPSASPTPTISPTPSPTVSPSPTPVDGYLAEYWNTPTAGSAPAMPVTIPDVTRVEANIDNYWGTALPVTGIAADKYIVRWTKNQTFAAGTYQFWTESDDGIRVYIDDELIINQWNDHGVTAYTGNKTLTAGSHAIRVEYYENRYDAVAKFRWTQL